MLLDITCCLFCVVNASLISSLKERDVVLNLSITELQFILKLCKLSIDFFDEVKNPQGTNQITSTEKQVILLENFIETFMKVKTNLPPKSKDENMKSTKKHDKTNVVKFFHSLERFSY